ncbi:MAG: zinc-binding dehydrogenase, partial [Methyloligellaceae bacterium]
MIKPKNLKAAILVKTGHDVKIEDGIELPELKTGQVLVKIHYAGVCHSQLMEARGARGEDAYLPHFLGHEGTATVVEIGPDVTKVKSGDKVIPGWIKASGIDGGPTQYRGPNGEIINSGAVTTFSNYAVISENRLVLKPPNTPADLAVLYGCALPTGAGLVFNELKPKEQSSIAIVGLGGIGLSALMAATQFAPTQLIAIDIEDQKLALSRELGATHCIKADASDLIEQVYNLTGGQGVDYAIEAAGLVKTIELGFDLIRRNGGELIFASHPKAGDRISIDPFELICGKNIRGTWGGNSSPDKDIPLLDQMYAQGKLNLEPLLS